MPCNPRHALRACCLVPLFASAFLGCSGGGSSSPPQRTFITWIGSANGVDVVDHDNEAVRFFADTNTMWYRGIELVNTTIDTSANVVWNGGVIGGVYYIEGEQDTVITGLVSLSGTMIDLTVSAGTCQWSDSGEPPIFATAPALLPAAHGDDRSAATARTSLRIGNDGRRFRLVDGDEEPDATVRGYAYLQAAR